MEQALIISLGKQALTEAFLVAAPMLGFGLAAGLLMSIFQAVTSIQDMTLTLIPKILAVVLALAIFFPWMLNHMVDFTTNLLTNIPQWVK
jgi:flagellar biosynthetic protein FliQ